VCGGAAFEKRAAERGNREARAAAAFSDQAIRGKSQPRRERNPPFGFADIASRTDFNVPDVAREFDIHVGH
jgi:hypothetical protein